MTSRTDVPSQDEYDPEEAAGDTDQEEEHMECESYADNKEIKTIVPGAAAARRIPPRGQLDPSIQ